jgi:hypothetical protein
MDTAEDEISDLWSVSINTPQGVQRYEGDGWFVLALLASGDLVGLVSGYVDYTGLSLEQAADRVLKVCKSYWGRYGNSQRTAASAGDVEADLVRCYLQGMRIDETVQWLGDEKGFRATKSAVGRYWKVLRRLGITPPGGLKLG